MNFLYRQRWAKAAMVMSAMLLSANVFATGKSEPSQMDNPLALALVVIASALLLIIGTLAYVLIGAAGLYLERTKEKEKGVAGTALKTLVVIAFCLVSSSLLAQDAAPADAAKEVVSTTISGLPKSSFYTLSGVIGLEIIVILVMAYFVKVFTAKEKTVAAVTVEEVPQTQKLLAKWKVIWTKLNGFRSQNEEQEITLDHSYDGIRELDNRLPRWWIWGFYLTIVFSCVYLYRNHVSHTAPSSIEEYGIEMAKAEAQKEEYLKHAANNVDENTVKLLTEVPAIEEGHQMFTTNCAPCHGDKGQGIVGPNLTDDYWLHGGSIHDVFKTIKYGYPEKGMKSWKDDFSPTQIAKIASFIKSIHGSNPANAKERQGELFKDDAAPAKDSANLSAKQDVQTGGKEAAL